MFGKKSEKQSDLELFTIYDSKSKSYGIPMLEKNKDVLVREILNQFQDINFQSKALLLNAEDYSVFRIGFFDKSTGVLTSQNPEHIVNLHDLRAISKPANAGPGIVPT